MKSWRACGPARKTPQQALDSAVQRGNQLLRRFEQATKS